jgi:hypothetical protein
LDPSLMNPVAKLDHRSGWDNHPGNVSSFRFFDNGFRARPQGRWKTNLLFHFPYTNSLEIDI